MDLAGTSRARPVLRGGRVGRWAWLAIAAVAIGGGSVVAWTCHRGDASASCGDAAARRRAVWNERVRDRVTAGLAGAPWSGRVVAGFDEVARAWETSYRTVCDASREDGALAALRMRCLERGLDRIGALAATVGAGAPLELAARIAAPLAVAALPSPAACETFTDAAAFAIDTDPAAPGPDRAHEIERDLDRGWGAIALGRDREAGRIATATRAAIAPRAAPALRARVLALAAATTSSPGSPGEARAALQAALDAAIAAHAASLELDAWIALFRADVTAGEPTRVLAAAARARAAAARAGDPAIELDVVLAAAARAADDLAAAKDLLAHALAATSLAPAPRARIELELGAVELAQGDSTAALPVLTRARDGAITAFGDRHPELARYDDELAAAHRARGKLRAALALHTRSLALRTAALGADDRAIATSLYHRARTELEAGEVARAEHSLHVALAIRTRADGASSPTLGELYAALGACDLARDTSGADPFAQALRLDPRLAPALPLDLPDAPAALAIPPLAADEPLSLARAAALVAKPPRAPADRVRLAASLHDRWRPSLDPALTVLVGRAMLAAGDRSAALANLFAAAIDRSGDEPNRTALAAAVGLARCEDPRAGQAARTAISLYQAMPELGRADLSFVQERAKLP